MFFQWRNVFDDRNKCVINKKKKIFLGCNIHFLSFSFTMLLLLKERMAMDTENAKADIQHYYYLKMLQPQSWAKLSPLIRCRQQKRSLSGGWGCLVCAVCRGRVFQQIWGWCHLSHTDGGLERRRLQHGVMWAVGPLERSGGERLMVSDGLMDNASLTCTTYANQEKHYLKWMTACKNVPVCVWKGLIECLSLSSKLR